MVSMEPQVIVVAGSNDHLQSRGLLSRLTDGSIPSNEVIGEAIMTLLSAMAEVEAAARQRFTMNVVKVIFVLSPGYAALPEPLQFVYTMVTTIAEGRFNVIIPAPNRVVDPDNYYPSRSELPAVWADISNAIQGLRDCSTTRLVLDEVLGLELSNFARLLKLRPGVDDDHLLVQQVADDLWFRQMDHAENEQGRMIRKNMTSAEEDLMAMALRTKPHNNVWLYLSPRLCTLGEDAFEHAPAIIKEIHVYLKNLFDARELAGGKMSKPDADDDELMDQDDNDDETGSKTEKPGETDLGALERDLLEYRFSEDDDGEVDGSLLLMAPSSFMSPTKEASADLSPMDPISQARECRSRDPQRLLHESPRRRKIEESMKISFLSTLPEEEWERYQMELEGKTGATWCRVNFMEKSWDVIRRYGTQSIMKVGIESTHLA